MKKVSIIIESLSGGGAEKVLSTMLQHIDFNRFEINLCCIVNTGKYIKSLNKLVKYSYILPEYSKLNWLQRIIYRVKYKLVYNYLPLRIVYQAFLPKECDIEIAFTEGYATKLLSHSSSKKSRKIAWVHCDLYNFHWTKNIFKSLNNEEKCYNSFDQIIGVSNDVTESLLRLLPGIRSKTITLYNPVDSNKITSMSLQPISITYSSDNIKLISVGRLTKPKAFDRLIRIIAKLISENYKLELWILGDGELRAELNQLIEDNNVSDCIKLLGFKDNPYSFYAKSDLFVCSSITEGFSTAATEALILGIPIVTTNCSGMYELFGERECGIITENSENSLYLGIKRAISNPELLSHYRKEAQSRGKCFSLEQRMSEIEALLLMS